MSIAVTSLSGTPLIGQKTTRLWTVDLAKNSAFSQRLETNEMLLDTPSLVFLTNDLIALGFLEGEEIGFNPHMQKSTYDVISLKQRDGSTTNSLKFTAYNDSSRVIPVSNGEFLVLADFSLKKFDSAFTQIDSYPTVIGNTDGHPDIWLADVSPDHRRVLLYHHGDEKETATWSWLNVSDFKLLESFESALALNISALDGKAVFSGGGGKLLFDAGHVSLLCAICDAYVLSGDKILLSKQPPSPIFPRKYTIESATGEVVASKHQPGGVYHLARSMNTSRVAFFSGGYSRHYDAQHQSIGINAEVNVVDWSNGRTIAKIDVSETAALPSGGLSQSVVALSPDGKYLLVLMHQELTCYLLP